MAGDEQLPLSLHERRLALVELYAQMAALTEPHCAQGAHECRPFHLFWKYRCCDRRFCELARERAAAWGVTISETGNPDLPFMSPGGCVMPPHLRSMCTVHLCHVSHAARSHVGEGGLTEYDALRKKIEILEHGG